MPYQKHKYMETLIGILFYIGAMTTNVTYTDPQIYQIEIDNQEQVNTVEDDPQLSYEAEQNFTPYEIERAGGDKVIIYEDIQY